jgi:hypothetical protein
MSKGCFPEGVSEADTPSGWRRDDLGFFMTFGPMDLDEFAVCIESQYSDHC